jgi:hypothetical protein
VRLLAATVIALVACSGGKTDPPPRPPPPVPIVKHTPPAGVTTITGFDPLSGMHLDDDGHRTDTPQPAVVQPAHAGHPVDITLRSSPSGAEVAVDGRNVGATPTFSTVIADGSEHEFTFVLPHHTVARYRFVPVTSGVLHARLEPVIDEPPSGAEGDDDSPEAAPTPGAGSELVAPPPAPVAKPDAAAPSPNGFGPQP